MTSGQKNHILLRAFESKGTQRKVGSSEGDMP